MLRHLVVVAAALLFAVGCNHSRVITKDNTYPVPQGIIKTEGVIIAAVDGSFVLKSGETFITPYDSVIDLTSNDGDSYVVDGVATDMFGYYSICPSCKDVRVTVPGRNVPLHGVLFFGRMTPEAYGPGSRYYLIEIPDKYVQEATDGRVSMVVEWVDLRGLPWSQAGWVLWLSDIPLR